MNKKLVLGVLAAVLVVVSVLVFVNSSQQSFISGGVDVKVLFDSAELVKSDFVVESVGFFSKIARFFSFQTIVFSSPVYYPDNLVVYTTKLSSFDSCSNSYVLSNVLSPDGSKFKTFKSTIGNVVGGQQVQVLNSFVIGSQAFGVWKVEAFLYCPDFSKSLISDIDLYKFELKSASVSCVAEFVGGQYCGNLNVDGRHTVQQNVRACPSGDVKPQLVKLCDKGQTCNVGNCIGTLPPVKNDSVSSCTDGDFKSYSCANGTGEIRVDCKGSSWITVSNTCNTNKTILKSVVMPPPITNELSDGEVGFYEKNKKYFLYSIIVLFIGAFIIVLVKGAK